MWLFGRFSRANLIAFSEALLSSTQIMCMPLKPSSPPPGILLLLIPPSRFLCLSKSMPPNSLSLLSILLFFFFLQGVVLLCSCLMLDTQSRTPCVLCIYSCHWNLTDASLARISWGYSFILSSFSWSTTWIEEQGWIHVCRWTEMRSPDVQRL